MKPKNCGNVQYRRFSKIYGNDTLLSRGLDGNIIYWPRPAYVLEKSEALAEDFSSTYKGRGQ